MHRISQQARPPKTVGGTPIPDWQLITERKGINIMKYHLAILTPGWIDLILDGSKTIESRFTKVRCAPFGKVHEGDSVYLKESGGLVKGMFRVAG